MVISGCSYCVRGLHELGPRPVLLASLASSAFNEADSPSTWLGKSVLAHQISALFKRNKTYSLYIFSTNLDYIPLCLPSAQPDLAQDFPPTCFLFTRGPLCCRRSFTQNFGPAPDCSGSPYCAGPELTLLFLLVLLSNIPACLEMGWGCTRLCHKGNWEQLLGAASLQYLSYKLFHPSFPWFHSYNLKTIPSPVVPCLYFRFYVYTLPSVACELLEGKDLSPSLSSCAVDDSRGATGAAKGQNGAMISSPSLEPCWPKGIMKAKFYWVFIMHQGVLGRLFSVLTHMKSGNLAKETC